MKKALTLLAFLVAAVTVQAQKVTEGDLLGTWKLVSYKDQQVTIDAIKGTYVLNAEFIENLTPAELKEEEHDYAIMARQYKVATMAFEGGNKVRQLIGEETYSGTYTLETNNKVTEIFVVTEDGEEEEPAAIFIKDNKLYVTVEDEIELIYKRQ